MMLAIGIGACLVMALVCVLAYFVGLKKNSSIAEPELKKKSNIKLLIKSGIATMVFVAGGILITTVGLGIKEKSTDWKVVVVTISDKKQKETNKNGGTYHKVRIEEFNRLVSIGETMYDEVEVGDKVYIAVYNDGDYDRVALGTGVWNTEKYIYNGDKLVEINKK